MRKIVDSTFVSLDGVTELLEKWHVAHHDDSATAFATKQILGCDAVLMGRLTYEAVRRGNEQDPQSTSSPAPSRSPMGTVLAPPPQRGGRRAAR